MARLTIALPSADRTCQTEIHHNPNHMARPVHIPYLNDEAKLNITKSCTRQAFSSHYNFNVFLDISRSNIFWNPANGRVLNSFTQTEFGNRIFSTNVLQCQ